MQNFDKILTIKPVRYAAAAHRTPYRAERRTACFVAKPEKHKTIQKIIVWLKK